MSAGLLRETLKNLRGARKLEEMAVLMGVHKNTIVNYERGDRLPDIDFLATLASRVGTDFLGLVRLRLEASAEEQVRAQASVLDGRAPRASGPTQDREYAGGIVLSLCPITLGAGVPAAGEASDAEGRGDQMAAWIRAGLDSPSDKLCVWRMVGSSMSPTLEDGDTVLIDTGTAGAEVEGIYLLLSPDGLWVKRLQILPGGVLRLCGDSPAYGDFQVARAEMAAKGIAVVGRVVRVLKKL